MLRLPKNKAVWEEPAPRFRHWREESGASTTRASGERNWSVGLIQMGDLKALESLRVLEITCMALKDRVQAEFGALSEAGEFSERELKPRH